MCPLVISAAAALGRRRRTGRVSLQPFPNYVMIKLLGPEEPAEGLTHHRPSVVGQFGGSDARIEFVGLLAALFPNPLELASEWIVHQDVRESKPNRRRSAGRHIGPVIGGRLRASPLRIH